MQRNAVDRWNGHGLLSFALTCLLAFPLMIQSGCGEEDPQVITIELQPWTLRFNLEKDLYLVERNLYLSLIRFAPSGNSYKLSGVVRPPAAGGFLPWGQEVATGGGAADRVAFLTDVSTANPRHRLLAVNPDFGDAGLDGLLLAQTDGPNGNPFHELRAVASLYWLDNSNPQQPRKYFRVFVIDHDPDGEEKIQVADYDIDGKTFTFRNPISWAGAVPPAECPDAFVDLYGLAADPDHNALYVADRRNDALYRFSGIQQGGAVTCDKQRKFWKNAQDLLNEPSGVAYLAGNVQAPGKNFIAVADSKNLRVTAFTWDGNDFLAENVPDNFQPLTGAAPFDLTFDPDQNLWATYPQSNAIAGPG